MKMNSQRKVGALAIIMLFAAGGAYAFNSSAAQEYFNNTCNQTESNLQGIDAAVCDLYQRVTANESKIASLEDRIEALENGVTPTPTPTPTPVPGFKASYWNTPGSSSNPNFPSTAPTLTRVDSTVNFNWGHLSPDPSIHADHFVARWTKTESFTTGAYKFTVTGDDGIRLYIDNALVIDQWRDQGSTTYSYTTNMSDGSHDIKLEYYENAGGAVVSLAYELAPLPALGLIGLSRTSAYPDQTVSAPRTGFKLASFTLSGNSTEAVNINTIDIGFLGGDTFDASDDLSNVYLKWGVNTSTVKANVADGSSTNLSTGYAVNITVPTNGVVALEIWGDIGPAVTPGIDDTMRAYIRATGVGASSGSATYADVDSDTDTTDSGAEGQKVTIASASISAVLDASTPVSSILRGNSTQVTGVWKLQSLNDSFTVTELTFSLPAASTVTTVALKDGSITLATRPSATSMTFTGLSLSIPANSTKIISIDLALGNVGTGFGNTGESVRTALTSGKANSSAGVMSAITESNPTGDNMYVYKSVPTLISASLPSTELSSGTKAVARFTIAANGGSIAWKEVLLDISKSFGSSLSSPTLWDVDSNTQIPTMSSFQNGTTGVSTACGTDNSVCELLITVGTKANTVEQQVASSRTYEVRAVVGGIINSGDFLTAKIPANLGHVNSVPFASVDNDTTVDDASFVWSDLSASSHGTTSSDWVNEHLVKFLPTANWFLAAP